MVLPALAALIAVFAVGAVVVAQRLTAALPPGAVRGSLPASFIAPGTPPAIAAPASGSLALDTSVDGTVASVRADAVRPIGSVAKTMTALLVLRQRPLPAGADGPVLSMTQADVALYRQTVAEQGSFVPVTAGERLSERQLLLALMLPSANNIAETLARWIGGTRDAFIAMLNATAAALQMTHTHFADPSGYSPQTVSSAGDLVLLGRAATAVPALMQIVTTQSATLPDGLVLRNLDSLLAGEPGWIGIKTGWTPAAGGCLLFAAQQEFAGGTPPVTVIGAVLGQPPLAAVDPAHPELGGAFSVARAAAGAAFGAYEAISPAAVIPSYRGTVTARWGDQAAVVPGDATGTGIVVREGTALSLVASTHPVGLPAAVGAAAGEVRALVRGHTVFRWTLTLQTAIAAPSWWWRLTAG